MRKLTVLFMTAVFTLAFLACDNSTSPPDMNRDPTLIHPPASISIGYDADSLSIQFSLAPNPTITDVNQYRIYIRHHLFGETHLTSQGINTFITTGPVGSEGRVNLRFNEIGVGPVNTLPDYLGGRGWNFDSRAGFSFGVSVMCPDRPGIRSAIRWSSATVRPFRCGFPPCTCTS